MAALEATGLFRAYVPKRFGGYEVAIDTFIDIGTALGGACASTGWVTTFCMEHNWLLAHFGEEGQEAIFGKQPYVLAPGSISPNGRAKAVDGGHVLSGRWSWGTGVMHADWVILNGIIVHEDRRREARLFAMPRADVEVDDTWYAAGMCGTGSNDIVAHDVFVPQHLSQDVSPMRNGQSPGARWHASPTFRYPMVPFLALDRRVAVGRRRGRRGRSVRTAAFGADAVWQFAQAGRRRRRAGPPRHPAPAPRGERSRAAAHRPRDRSVGAARRAVSRARARPFTARTRARRGDGARHRHARGARRAARRRSSRRVRCSAFSAT